MKLTRVMATLAAAFVLVAGFAVSAQAAKYPERPITIIVPWAPGGGADIVARAISKPLEKELGTTIVVVNKPGGSGTIGTSATAHARPDGYTIGLINNGGVIHQYYYGGLDYKPEDLDMLCMILQVPIMLAVPANSPIKTIADYVKVAKEKDGKLMMGTSSMGGGTHIPMEQFFKLAGIKVQVLPQPGGGVKVVAALAGEHLESAVAHPSELYGQAKAGTVRALAVADEKRLEAWPDVPTFKETGYDVVDSVWRAFMLPKGVSPEIKATLVAAIEKAHKDPTFRETIERMGDMPTFMGTEEFTAFYKKDDAKVKAIIESLGLINMNVKK